MLVLVLTAVPKSLRGALTRWLLEIAPGVFVGSVSARVRAMLWQMVADEMGSGRALLVYSAPTEQGYALESLGHDWQPVDLDGHLGVRRPVAGGNPMATTVTAKKGWSAARRFRRR